MYIKMEPGVTRLVLRELDGNRLDSPITVEFSAEGIARVKEGVGELLADLFEGVEITRREDSSSDAPVSEENDQEE